ncbi:MAG TPA: adenylate/guanylate cyclase domain-containing protein [Gemmatimonadota bacterium]|nr:adenylate/guanylate cyclase domain-containing protein [Gemmatimonadota bacterium]
MPAAPSGTVTFLFTDIEGSTTAWERDRRAMGESLARHDRIAREVFEASGGRPFATAGDAFQVAYQRAAEAIRTALDLQRALADGADLDDPVATRVRVAVHSGEAEERGGDYFGPPLNRTARILAIGHGGQVLVSGAAAALTRESLPDGASLVDLGVHRLKDLREPERMWRLAHADLPDDFPPLRSLDRLPHNLPVQLTSFVGREREIDEIRDLVRAHRLLTLTGSGGSGKTRLGLQAAAEMVEAFPDGAWFVDLSSLADPGLFAQTAAQALGLRAVPGRDIDDVLTEHLASRTLLVVLDNCEHLIEASAAWSERSLRAAPGLSILATSREALGTAGEVTWPVPSLGLPGALEDRAEVARSEAGRLFEERVRLVDPRFEIDAANAGAIARICRRLDGIPLAIELAAARVRVLTPDEIADRLHDRFRMLSGGRRALSRHQTLTAAVDWSYDLLEADERALFERLSVFTGGWTLEAAEAVGTDDGIDRDAILDLLTHLVDKSLVVVERPAPDETRYRMLETTRQYAEDRLARSGGIERARARHAELCQAFVRRCVESPSDEEADLRRRLGRDYDNVRAALEWGLADAKTAEAAAEMATGLAMFWYRKGLMAEGIEWLERARAVPAELSAPTRIGLLSALAGLRTFLGDLPGARRAADQALDLAREHGDEGGLVRALTAVARIDVFKGLEADFPGAIAVSEEGIALARRIGDGRRLGVLLTNLGEFYRARGDPERARALNQEAMELGYLHIANRYNLGHIALELGDPDEAERQYAAALRLARESDERLGLVNQIDALAQLATVRGDYQRGARLFAAFETQTEAIGLALSPVDLLLHQRLRERCREALGSEAFERARAEGRGLSIEEALAGAYGAVPP